MILPRTQRCIASTATHYINSAIACPVWFAISTLIMLVLFVSFEWYRWLLLLSFTAHYLGYMLCTWYRTTFETVVSIQDDIVSHKLNQRIPK